jgi:hypothetical protein
LAAPGVLIPSHFTRGERREEALLSLKALESLGGKQCRDGKAFQKLVLGKQISSERRRLGMNN